MGQDRILCEMAPTVSDLKGRRSRTLRAWTLHRPGGLVRLGPQHGEGLADWLRFLRGGGSTSSAISTVIRTTGVAHRLAEVHRLQPDAEFAEGHHYTMVLARAPSECSQLAAARGALLEKEGVSFVEYDQSTFGLWCSDSRQGQHW